MVYLFRINYYDIKCSHQRRFNCVTSVFCWKNRVKAKEICVERFFSKIDNTTFSARKWQFLSSDRQSPLNFVYAYDFSQYFEISLCSPRFGILLDSAKSLYISVFIIVSIFIVMWWLRYQLWGDYDFGTFSLIVVAVLVYNGMKRYYHVLNNIK